MISYIIYRCRAEKPTLAQQIAMHTITSLARSAWTCIFSSLPVWMSFQDNRMSCVQMRDRLGHHGSSIRIANHTRFSAGYLQNWPHGSATTSGRSCSYPQSATGSGVWGS